MIWEPDNGVFKMWYFAGGNDRYIGYAESRDGIHWNKPSLALYEINGIRDNNVCFIGIYTPTVYRDPMANDSEQRYMMWALQTRDSPDGIKADHGLYRFFSADGKHWKRESRTPVIAGYPTRYTPTYPGEPNRELVDGVATDHSYTHWIPALQKFVCFHKVKPPNPRRALDVDAKWTMTRRQFCRFESTNGIHWNTDSPTWAFVPDAQDDQYDPYIQFYGLGFHAVGDFYLATTMLYHSSAKNDHLEVGLAYSTDTVTWHRPFRDQYLLRHGAEGEWDWGQARQAVSLVEKDDTWWLYYAGTPHTHYDYTVPRGYSGIGLAQMPRGRVVSARCWRKKGHWTVGPFLLPGDELLINARIYNELRVVVLDERDEPVPGYERTINQVDDTEIPVDWGKLNLSSLSDKPVKLRFELNNAEVFGFTLR